MARLKPLPRSQRHILGRKLNRGHDVSRRDDDVKDISVGYKGGGMKLGATRTGEINWTCWTWQELERLTPHFLSPGKTVLLEWGWTGVGALKKIELLDIFKNDPVTFIKTFDTDKINNLNN